MRRANGRLTLLATGILAMAAIAHGAVATNGYLVTVDTSSVNGQTGTIDLQFNAGALTSENACVTINNFSSDGTLGTPPTTTGSVTGTLATSVAINNGSGGCSTKTTYTSSTVNEYTQPITFGNTLSFLVTLSGPGVTAPDPTTYTSGSSFGVAFTAGGNPALTTDPSNFAGNITLNLDGTNTPNGSSLVTIQPAELVTVGTSPSGLSFSVDGTPYTASQTFAWAISSKHTLTTTSPQGSGGTRNTFTSWSDGTTTATDNITVVAGTTSYTANFSTSYLLTTSASPAADGSVTVNTPSPTGDGYYPASTIVSLTATPANSIYKFLNWTGSVANSNNASTTVTMSAAESVTANFGLNQINVTVGTSPSGFSFTVDGTTYTASKTLTWTIGDQHTIATTSPQLGSDGVYTFTKWSDGGAISHPVTASATTTTYTATFNNADLTSSQISTTLKAIGYNKNTQVATYNYTITNVSKQTITAPVQIVLLTPLLPGVNNSGTIGGHPYWTINTSLAPKNTVGLTIEVKSTKPNPTLTLIAFSGHF